MPEKQDVKAEQVAGENETCAAVRYPVELTESELLAIDGVVNPAAQEAVNRIRSAREYTARFSVSMKAGLLLADIVSVGRKTGVVNCDAERCSLCRVCGKGRQPILYKSGRNRGRVKDYYSPAGYDFGARFVRISGYPSVGCCADCANALMPHIAELLDEFPCQVDSRITGHQNRFVKSQNKACVCGWTGHERELLKLRTLMRDGFYPGKCPSCGAENLFLGPNNIKNADGFVLVEVKPKAEPTASQSAAQTDEGSNHPASTGEAGDSHA